MTNDPSTHGAHCFDEDDTLICGWPEYHVRVMPGQDDYTPDELRIAFGLQRDTIFDEREEEVLIRGR